MSCPDLIDIVRTSTGKVDPAVLAHLRECRSCRLDWQILQGARVLSDPEVNAQEPGEDPLNLSRLNRQAMTRIRLMARLSRDPVKWRQLWLTGLLITFGDPVVPRVERERGKRSTLRRSCDLRRRSGHCRHSLLPGAGCRTPALVALGSARTMGWMVQPKGKDRSMILCRYIRVREALRQPIGLQSATRDRGSRGGRRAPRATGVCW